MPKLTNTLMTASAICLGLGAQASAQIIDGPSVACQNYDSTLRYFGEANTASQAVLGHGASLAYEERLPDGLPLLVAFGLEEPSEIRATLDALDGGDPVLTIRNAAGEVVAYNDDGSNGLNSEVQVSLPAGNYCGVLSAWGVESFTARAELRHAGVGAAPEETAPPAQGASALTEGACFAGAEVVDLGDITTAEDALRGSTIPDETPYMSFRLDTPATVKITAENQSADPVLSLYKTDGTLWDENDDYDGLNAQLLVTDMSPGEWCLELDALSDSSLAILVNVTTVTPEEMAHQAYARAERPPLSDDSYPHTPLGSLQTTAQATANVGEGAWWARFSVSEPSLVEIDAPETGQDPVLVLFDGAGNFMVTNDDFGVGYGARIYARLEPGEYWVATHLFSHEEAVGMAVIPVTLTRYVAAQE